MSSDHADNKELNGAGPEVKQPDFQGFTIATNSDNALPDSKVQWATNDDILHLLGFTREMFEFALQTQGSADESTVENKNAEEGAQDGEKI